MGLTGTEARSPPQLLSRVSHQRCEDFMEQGASAATCWAPGERALTPQGALPAVWAFIMHASNSNNNSCDLLNDCQTLYQVLSRHDVLISNSLEMWLPYPHVFI